MKTNKRSITWIFVLTSFFFTNCKAQKMTTTTADQTRTINVTGTAEKKLFQILLSSPSILKNTGKKNLSLVRSTKTIKPKYR